MSLADIGRQLAALGIVVIASISAGCSTVDRAAGTRGADEATWQLSPDQEIAPDTTEVTIEVTRTSCSDGETGTAFTPTVEVKEDRIVILAEVEHLPNGDYTCPGNDAVTVRVTLPEPVGTRPLIDGGCDKDRNLAIVVCEDPVRWRPS